MRIVFIALMVIHGGIHFFGFMKALGISGFEQIKQEISPLWGIIWLLAGISLFAAVISYIAKWPLWWILAIAGIALSQLLVFMYWSDARWGSIPNLIILVIALLASQTWSFKTKYLEDVRHGLQRQSAMEAELLNEGDIQHLPQPVKKYLQYVGVVGQPKVRNVYVRFDAEMRGKEQDWFSLDAEQYNFFDQNERLFWLDAKVKGLPTKGYHRYKQDQSSMDIKLLSVFPVVNASGKEMFEAETVTMFNDMCFLAPATLIDPDIQWTLIDSLTAKARFKNQGVEIQAILYFNEAGQLINFESDDRYDISVMKKYKFTTPLSDYKEEDGRMVPTYGEAVWHYPEGPFVYGKYTLREIRYNVREMQ